MIKKTHKLKHFHSNRTYPLHLPIHIQVDGFGGIGGGAGAHVDLSLLSYTPAEILAWIPD